MKWSNLSTFIAKLTCNSLTHIREFCYFCCQYRSHSSMDRIQDSGSCDLGSNPGGITWLYLASKRYDLSSYLCSFLFNFSYEIATFDRTVG